MGAGIVVWVAVLVVVAAVAAGLALFLSRRRGPVVSLSIEGNTIRVVSCQGRRVSAWKSIPFNPTLLQGGFVANAAGLSQVLKSALRDVKAGRVIVALPGFQSVSRVIALPKVKGLRPAVAVPREARRLMGVSLDSSYLFWQSLASAGTQWRFFVLAVPRVPLLALIDALRQAGIRPWKIDTKPLALARAVNQGHAVVGSLESNSIDVVVVLDHAPVVIRSLFLGEEAVVPEVVLPRFVEEVSRTITFYNDINRGNPLPRTVPIYLCGALSGNPEVGREIERATGHQVGQADAVLSYPPDFPVSQMMVNLGLVMKAL